MVQTLTASRLIGHVRRNNASNGKGSYSLEAGSGEICRLGTWVVAVDKVQHELNTSVPQKMSRLLMSICRERSTSDESPTSYLLTRSKKHW